MTLLILCKLCFFLTEEGIKNISKKKIPSYPSLTNFASTWHHAGESNSPLANEFSSNRIVIPHMEPHQGNLWHLNAENEGLLPHRIET